MKWLGFKGTSGDVWSNPLLMLAYPEQGAQNKDAFKKDLPIVKMLLYI